jgi:hypothetical protein
MGTVTGGAVGVVVVELEVVVGVGMMGADKLVVSGVAQALITVSAAITPTIRLVATMSISVLPPVRPL